MVIRVRFQIDDMKTKADAVEPFLKMLGAKSETMPKLKLTRKDLPSDEMKVIVLEKA